MDFGGCTFQEYSAYTNEELVDKFKQGMIPFDPILYRFRNTVYKLANEQFVPNFTKEELQQELSEFLFDAAKKYDPERADKFSTFVYTRLMTRINWLRRLESNDKRCVTLHTDSLDEPVGNDGESAQLNKYDLIPAKEDYFGQSELLSGVQLTERENIIVNMVLEGHMNKHISEHLVALGYKLTPTRIGQILRGLQPKFAFLRA